MYLPLIKQEPLQLTCEWTIGGIEEAGELIIQTWRFQIQSNDLTLVVINKSCYHLAAV